jgi:hypothetical protein
MLEVHDLLLPAGEGVSPRVRLPPGKNQPTGNGAIADTESLLRLHLAVLND